MRTRERARLRAAALAICLLAFGCGSDGGEEASDTTSSPGGPTSTGGVAGALANTVKGENPASWGVKDKKVTGPGGLTMDLSKCPSNWKDTGGITDTEIRFGASVPLSGSAAQYGGISAGMKAYFDHINATEGGVAGKKLTIDIKDNGYEAARGKATVDELVETGNIFASASTVGTPIMLAVYDKLNEQCIPSLYTVSGHPAWGDTVNHPWTTGLWLPYTTEATLWADYILEKYGPGTTVAALAWNNDYGSLYKQVFTRVAKEKGLNFVKVETHEGSAPNVTNEMTTLASTNADVFIGMTGVSYPIQALNYIAGSSWQPKERIVSYTNNTASVYKPAGAAADGVLLVGGVKDILDPTFAEEPFIKTYRAVLEKAGLDYAANGQIGQSATFAWPLVENLKRAAQLPGGLTRSNMMLAVRSYAAKHPMYFDGITFEMNGAKDAFPIEGGSWVRYTIEPGKDVGTFKPIGKVADANGTTPQCNVWDGKECKTTS
ncbi:MAG: ABC transporter substrate-binding protein [Acidimicrobiales bacterium]